MQQEIRERIKEADAVLIGIGENFRSQGQEERVKKAYDKLYKLLEGKSYFIVTMNTDEWIMESSFEKENIVAPCGSVRRLQCENACTTGMFYLEKGEKLEEKEFPVCPKCGGKMIFNTIEAEKYVEDGYLLQWEKYQAWLQKTLNRKLCILELGVEFSYPSVIRFPFEKIAYLNQKAYFVRVNAKYPQLFEGIGQRGMSIKEDSLDFLLD